MKKVSVVSASVSPINQSTTNNIQTTLKEGTMANNSVSLSESMRGRAIEYFAGTNSAVGTKIEDSDLLTPVKWFVVRGFSGKRFDIVDDVYDSTTTFKSGIKAIEHALSGTFDGFTLTEHRVKTEWEIENAASEFGELREGAEKWETLVLREGQWWLKNAKSGALSKVPAFRNWYHNMCNSFLLGDTIVTRVPSGQTFEKRYLGGEYIRHIGNVTMKAADPIAAAKEAQELAKANREAYQVNKTRAANDPNAQAVSNASPKLVVKYFDTGEYINMYDQPVSSAWDIHVLSQAPQGDPLVWNGPLTSDFATWQTIAKSRDLSVSRAS